MILCLKLLLIIIAICDKLIICKHKELSLIFKEDVVMKNENIVLSNEELQMVTGGKGAWQLSFNIIGGMWLAFPGSWLGTILWCAVGNTMGKAID